jgi:hypothetical protein
MSYLTSFSSAPGDPVRIDWMARNAWTGSSSVERGRACCELLEQGRILLVCDSDFLVSTDDKALLMGISPALVSSKNVSYSPQTGGLNGLRRCAANDYIRLALARYSAAISQLLTNLLCPYAQSWKIALSSFRPIEEADRYLSERYRNDRLHIDSFPARPTNGGRILRCFTNINVSEPRVWLTSDMLDKHSYQKLESKFEHIGTRISSKPLRKLWIRLAEICGIAARRSPYDRFMLRLHDRMKSDPSFLAAPTFRHEFAPGSTWLVFTDAVPHAVLKGRFALEQTFIVAREALLLPGRAPIAFVEQVLKNQMTAAARLRGKALS